MVWIIYESDDFMMNYRVHELHASLSISFIRFIIEAIIKTTSEAMTKTTIEPTIEAEIEPRKEAII